MTTEKPKLKILYFGGGPGSGPVFRALALWKAIKRAKLTDTIDFRACVYCPGYTPLLSVWGVPTYPDDLAQYKNYPQTEFTFKYAFKNWNPDIVISSYIVKGAQEALAEHPDCKGYLLLRDILPCTSCWLGKWDYDPKVWAGIFAIEPEAYLELTDAIPRIPNITGVNPVISCWPDELMEREDARAYLFNQVGIKDRGGPLAVVAHNGQGNQELVSMQRQVGNVLTSISRPSQIIHLSQSPSTHAARLPLPLAMCLNGVDTLIAAPGPNMFWEWQMLAANRPDAKAAWFPMPRAFDPQEERVKRYGRKGAYFDGKPFKNGADEIIAKVTKGLV
jgi:hypothetical protein